MATLKEVLERKKEVTDKISIQVRTISAALIVFTWSIFSSVDSSKAAEIRKVFTPFLLLIDIFAILALAADFLQYVCAQRVVENALSVPESKSSGNYLYDDEWPSYRAQNWAFLLKQIFCATAVLLTILIIIVDLLTH